jgi:hypothetical protein
VRTTRREPEKEHQRRKRKQKKKLVRFSSLGHLLRTCAILPRPHVERNDEFSSWKSLFFYRCTDAILFAPLKSDPDHRIKEAAKPPEQVEQVNLGTKGKRRKGKGAPAVVEQKGQPEMDRADNGQFEKGPASLEPNGTDKKTKEERRADYIREKTVAAAPPPCSPKTIYILADLVRQLSVKRLTHDTDA